MGPVRTAATEKPKGVSRRQLFTLGGAGAAGALAARVVANGSARAAGPGHGGIHVYVVTEQVQPKPPNDDFIHTFTLTLWGPDDDLSGMGCGWTEGNAVQNAVGTGVVGCVFGGHAKVENGVVHGIAVMMYSGMPDEKLGIPFPFEANLSTGFCRFTDMNMGMGTAITVEGTGTVRRV
jgi:hypothetical protein